MRQNEEEAELEKLEIIAVKAQALGQSKEQEMAAFYAAKPPVISLALESWRKEFEGQKETDRGREGSGEAQ